MSISAITLQPGANALNAAYRPVVLRVQASGPVIFCDIYFGGVFYKTLSKTQPIASNSNQYEFDIQDTAQEFLRFYLAPNGGQQIKEAIPIMTKCFCRFRSSTIDGNGFILPDAVEPVQGTGGTQPVAGTGTQSNDFFIVNVTLRHLDNQNLADHLNSYKKGSWSANAFPLTHRPMQKLALSDSSYFPALVPTDICINNLAIVYRYRGQQIFRRRQKAVTIPCNAIIQNLQYQQQANSATVVFNWEGIGDISSYVYQLDGGPEISISLTTLTLNSLTTGNHTLQVKGICQCGEGDVNTLDFQVEDPSTFVCTTTISSIVVTQIGPDTASVNWTQSGAATQFRYQLNNGAWVSASSKPFTISNLTPHSPYSSGNYLIKVQAICANGVHGGSATTNFDMWLPPSIEKVQETNTGPGGIRRQIFRIGTNVHPGNKFRLKAYGHTVEVVAVSGDTKVEITLKLRNAINLTPANASGWNSAGLAPSPGTNGYPPTAITTVGANYYDMQLTLDFASSFSYEAVIF